MSAMLTAEELKQFARTAGAMDCGIASAESLEDAPAGFRPRDIYGGCNSVAVMLRRMPAGLILPENPVPYTHAAYKMYEEMDRLSMEVLRFCEARGVYGAIVPADVPYLSWDAERRHGMGILSLKHAAVRAGLGIMGRSTIFIHPQLGNMAYIGAVLLDVALIPDPPLKGFACPPHCAACIKSCPQQAIGGGTVDQKLCREHSFFLAGRGWDLYNCNVCRRVCLLRDGACKPEGARA